MKKNNEFLVKIKNFTWKNYFLIIGENDFQLIKEKSKSKKGEIYSLVNSVVLDESEKSEQKILIASPIYRIHIKIIKPEDKEIILSRFEEIIKKNSEKTAFSKDYLNYLKENINYEIKNPYDDIIFKLNTYKKLMKEVNIQLFKFRDLIKEKLSGSVRGEFLTIHKDLSTIYLEMKKQFKTIKKNVKRDFLVNDKFVNEKENNSSSSSDEEKLNLNLNDENEETNIKVDEDNNNDENGNVIEIEDKTKKENQKGLYFLNTQLKDFYNPDYDFKERVKLPSNIKCPENLIKEIISTFTKKGPAPIYFNEPLSMGQKQCEKFFYLDMLTNAAKYIEDKPLQMCYICAFIIGELFLNIGRFLKPFNPILGETYEYYQNDHKFRYYSEQVKHKPQITAFVGETPEFIYYGDTLGDSSFKFLKGIELTFKNKIHIYLKKSGIHYIFNRPLIYIKGLMKPPMYNDYSGTIIIQDANDKSSKCELTFIEQSWTSNELGNFEGKSFSNENEVKYLIGGNWQEEIYITDPDGNNKKSLLVLTKNSTYLQNSIDKYSLPFYACNLNVTNEHLNNNLPKNDSRFRHDIGLLELGEDCIPKAQIYKNAYEEKQRNEIKDEGHEIQFFNEKVDEETEEIYYEPNGKYWEMKKNGELINNKYNDIFEIEEYFKREEEKVKSEKEKEEKEKKSKEKKDNK